MVEKLSNLFSVDRETNGPREREQIPLGLKRKAVETVVLANTIEPQAFRVGAIMAADISLESEQEGFSKHWMHWLGDEDVDEINTLLFDLKNKIHQQHGIKYSDSKKIIRNERKTRCMIFSEPTSIGLEM